ncbi:Cytokine receptor-like factor 3 [Trachymyrmex cornetzi]|uniref:Cytokine receptor-like factor 3 n=1 Tax=Trachymyrmex cornetzi TaxID=471704 RepID=A0A195DJJ9_9HYME|nr:Cytokine receptor-like factor 3 [Trachymyrmex cornetzi]
MEDFASIKGQIINSHKRRPDVILHTRNVMIPIVKPVPFKQSCDMSFLESRCQILRAKHYSNNTALLFSEKPLHTLYDPLENSLEVRRIGHWKPKNQSTKYIIFGKTDSPIIKKTSTSQNSYPSKRFSRKKKYNALQFPNAVLVQPESLTNKDLHKASSRSIKLSRKCDLSQIEERQIKHEAMFTLLPKIETPINNVMGKAVVSSPSQSFYDTIDTTSTVSTQSVSSLKIRNKKTFPNIMNKEKSIPSLASNHLHPSTSEYEINVLHYENDILSGNNFPQFAQSHLKSTNTNCSLVKIQNGNTANERNAIKSNKGDEDKIISDIKYSWEMKDWMSPSQRKKYDNAHNKSSYKRCSIKYSWQIIGISTQASLQDCNDSDYWSGILLTPSKNYNENKAEIDNNEIDHAEQDYVRYSKGKLKKYLILNNHMEQISEALTKQKLSDKLELEQIDNYDGLLHKYTIKPLTPNISSKSSVISDNGNERTKKEELLMRLTYALNKLNQYEGNIENKKSIETSYLDAKNTLAQKGAVLPRNVEENVKGIIQSAQEYIAKLDYQLKDLDNADQQIENSMMRTLKDIDGTFQSLLDDVYHEINKRRELLILETEIHKHESLIPLRACRREVEAQLQNAQNIISMSEGILQHPYRYSVNGFGKIISASNDIGRIPAVPYSEELPNINFDRPLNSYKEEIIEQISKLGCISRTIPVQIMNIEERPAGLFVKWHVTNPEYFAEEQIFIVEKANGEILDPASNKFETVYRGSETSCFIRNIPVDHLITLRVRIQADNVARSIHHVTRTSIPPYSWELDNKNYMITNGKIAEKVTNTINTLFSQGPQFDENHVIEFKFLEVPQEGDDDEGIALVYDPQGSNDTLKRAASLMITPQGKIFMDGDEKLMRLPRMCFGAVIMISAFRKNAYVLRVNIESENKCVTYDWRVQTPLYLAARFAESKKWHLKIE